MQKSNLEKLAPNLLSAVAYAYCNRIGRLGQAPVKATHWQEGRYRYSYAYIFWSGTLVAEGVLSKAMGVAVRKKSYSLGYDDI